MNTPEGCWSTGAGTTPPTARDHSVGADGLAAGAARFANGVTTGTVLKAVSSTASHRPGPRHTESGSRSRLTGDRPDSKACHTALHDNKKATE